MEGLSEIFIAAKCRNSEIQTDKDKKKVFQLVNTKKRGMLAYLLKYSSSNDGQIGVVKMSLLLDTLVTN